MITDENPDPNQRTGIINTDVALCLDLNIFTRTLSANGENVLSSSLFANDKTTI